MNCRLLAIGVLALVILAIRPTAATACGWWGDGESDASDTVAVDADGNPIEKQEVGQSPKVMTQRATRLLSDDATEDQISLAVMLLKKAAETGFPPAQNNLATLYEGGRGVPKDQFMAFKWFERAAHQSEPHAEHSLGTMYQEGRGAERDLKKAAYWMEKAAQKRHVGAACDLAKMALGNTDSLNAVKWNLIAVQLGKECGFGMPEMTKPEETQVRRFVNQWLSQYPKGLEKAD